MEVDVGEQSKRHVLIRICSSFILILSMISKFKFAYFLLILKQIMYIYT